MHNLQLGQLFIAILVISYVLYQQVALRPVKPSRYVILPIVLIYFTLKAICSLGGSIYVGAAPMILLVSLGGASGVAAGMITKVFKGEDGTLYQKGGVAAVALLLCTIPVRYVLRSSISSMPGGEILRNGNVSYLILCSSQIISRSLTIFARSPQVWALFLEKRRNKKRYKKYNIDFYSII